MKLLYLITTALIGCIIAGLVLSSCNNNRRGGFNNTFMQPIPNTMGRNPNMPAGPGACPTGSSVWGGVTCQGSNSQPFRDFLSSTLDVYDDRNSRVGDISCTPGNNQGFLFQLQVVLSGIVDLGGNNDDLNMQNSSELRFKIIDNPPAGFSGDSGPVANLTLRGRRGTLSGRDANFVFEDDKGTVTIKGTLNNPNFTGTMEFQNRVYWDGAASNAGGVLGNFSISACAAFDLGTNI